MAALLPLVVVWPLAATVIVFLSAGRIKGRSAGILATGAVGLSAMTGGVLAAGFMSGAVTYPLHVTLWEWMHVPGFSATIAFALDPVSLVMIAVVTIVGFLIHLYAIGYMAADPGSARFFGCMTLFVAAMLVLVLASDLLCLFIGWEGVGLCSYLLIGFWYDSPANTAAARKAFYITRIGDVAMLCGLLMMATATASLQIDGLLFAVTAGQLSPAVMTGSALLLLTGALAKSAQIPFQSWLPDAMAGPTPTSALIHAATMVTAGVYLLARLHGLFAAAAPVMAIMAAIGMLTLLVAACTALVQSDLKRILAWSTISQLGYMYLALGVGAWQAALFHLVTHACFKALLFLCAGVIIARVDHEQDIFRMGGLRRFMPGVTAAFVIGAGALAALPLVTAGFYSKEMILSAVWRGQPVLTPDFILSGHLLWGGALFGALLTALYIFRCVFLVFYGQEKTVPTGRTPWVMAVPLGCLAFLSVFVGCIEMPGDIAPVHLFTRFVDPAGMAFHPHEPVWLLLAGAITPVAGAGIAWIVWGRSRPVTRAIPETGGGTGDLLPVMPLRFVVRITRYDLPDRLAAAAGWMTRATSRMMMRARRAALHLAAERTAMVGREGTVVLVRMQNGRVRWYAGWIVAGLGAALAWAMLS